jgi:hypothetical protein
MSSFLKSFIPGWTSMFSSSFVSKQNVRDWTDWTPPKISNMSELDNYRHRRINGTGKSFSWDAETLGLVVHAFQCYQDQDQDQDQEVDVKSLHLEICQHVKTTIVSKAVALCKERAMQQCGITECEFNVVAAVIEEQVTCDFDRMSCRWIRMPTIRAVQTKLGQCACLARADISDLNDENDETRADYEQANVRKIIQTRRISKALREVWLDIMTPPVETPSRRWFGWI